MSNNTKTWVVGLVGVAVGAILAVTIFLISQPPAAREQVTGAIGAAERFRTEQIKEGDTGISGGQAGGAAGQVTMAQLVDVLGVRTFTAVATEVEKSDVLAKASADEMAEALGRASGTVLARVLASATHAERASAMKHVNRIELAKMFDELRSSVVVEAFDSLVASEKATVFNELNVNQERWAELTSESKVTKLGRLSEEAKAETFVRFNDRIQLEAFDQLAAERQCEAFRAAGLADDLVARSDVALKAKVFDAASMDAQRVWLAKSPEYERRLLNRIGSNLQEENRTRSD